MRPKRWLVVAGAVALSAAAAFLLWQRRATAAEIDRLARELALEDGSTVADVGAGKGRFALALARRVGSSGHVFATEIDPERLVQIREAIEREGAGNVSVVEAGVGSTGLEPACCNAVYLRDVYHHLTEPAAIAADLSRALRPGGRLVIVDFPPGWLLSRFVPVEGVPGNRGGHGVPPEVVIEELADAGFALERRIDDWTFRTYALVLRRP